ncbi:hypothetical protein N4G41_24945 [Kosakonia sacchari]|uniref:hypothetical protein n=1 Tax=Kosakonia sacchari TaxID=1158459 RepID=UPI002ACDCA7C|nr:hypothetical protein [Kosakonia sacchari]MDZ7324883.1 hypothetical protein [Kosakonia sacchari]
MGLPSFVVLCVLLLIVIVVLMVIIFVISHRLSKERDDNTMLCKIIAQQEYELKVLRAGQIRSGRESRP